MKKAKELFKESAKFQSGKRVPLPAQREYGTGLPVKKSKKK